MKWFAIRVWMATFLMAIGFAGTEWVRAGYKIHVRPLQGSLEQIPKELNGYFGTDIPLDDHVKEILNADGFVNRHYQRADGSTIALHASVWSRPESVASVAPHNPILCYTNTGWKILDQKTVEFGFSSGKLPLIACLFERNSERIVIVYWYQMGRTTFTSAREARRLHREMWGKKEWPPTIKLLLQTPSQSIDEALSKLEQFASSVFESTIDL